MGYYNIRYFLLEFNQEGNYDVIGSFSHMPFARKKAKEQIEFNKVVWGYSEGITICTDKHIRYYVSADGNEYRYASKTKLKDKHIDAINAYHKKRTSLLKQLS